MVLYVTSRAPRGTKLLTKAFFEAAEQLPEIRRGEVIKAALAAIRNQVKLAREKAIIVKAGSMRAGVPAPRKIGRPLGSKNKPRAEGKKVSQKVAKKAATLKLAA